MKNVLENIKKFRTEHKITQSEIAEKLGLTQPNYANFENGKIDITISRLEKVAEIFNVSVNDLLNGGVGSIPVGNDKEVEELRKENEGLRSENEQLKLKNENLEHKIKIRSLTDELRSLKIPEKESNLLFDLESETKNIKEKFDDLKKENLLLHKELHAEKVRIENMSNEEMIEEAELKIKGEMNKACNEVVFELLCHFFIMLLFQNIKFSYLKNKLTKKSDRDGYYLKESSFFDVLVNVVQYLSLLHNEDEDTIFYWEDNVFFMMDTIIMYIDFSGRDRKHNHKANFNSKYLSNFFDKLQSSEIMQNLESFEIKTIKKFIKNFVNQYLIDISNELLFKLKN